MIAIVTIEINGRTSPGPWPSATIKEELRKLVNDDEDGKEHRNDEEDEEDDCD